jgi:oxygen-independent coproporphyrinogen-3 oxidase
MQFDAAGRKFGVYLHVPYCTTRCGYCDFNTYTTLEFEPGVAAATWLQTASREVDLAANALINPPEISSVFFGGGTPTLLPAADLVGALKKLQETFGVDSAAEVTTEANPDSVDLPYLQELRAGGFNRISFGMQSAVPQVLKVLDRTHTPGRAADAVEWAVQAGFEHINLDLIYGSPGESLADLETSLQSVLNTAVDHVSAYALTLEPGTRMANQVKRGELQMPDDSFLAQMYELVDDYLNAQGFEWYEVSNWARPNGHCQHNLNYWQNQNWWGIGPGAHSHISGNRWWNVKHPANWTHKLTAGELPIAELEKLDATAIELEELMLGIRLKSGIKADGYNDIKIKQLISDGLLNAAAYETGRLELTRTGRLLADLVIRELGF